MDVRLRLLVLKHRILYYYRRFRKHMTLKFYLLSAVGLFVLFLLFALYTYISFANDLATPQALMNRNNVGLILYDRNDKVIYKSPEAHTSQFVPITQISPNLQKATIAIEDKDFYTHPGFSPRGIGRALYDTVLSGSFGTQGGSTITQQLVKNALLSPEKSVRRKLQELILSIEVERRYSKDQILEMYLNSIYYGSGAYGIGEASRVYFNTTPDKLTIAQASLLASIPVAPSYLSPYGDHIDALYNRRDVVLQKMEEQGYITPTQQNAAAGKPLTFSGNEPKDEVQDGAEHFSLWIRDYLYDKYGEDQVTRLGMRVKTSLDVDLNQSAKQILDSQVKALAYQKVTNGSVVSLNPKTGEVLAMVGSIDYANDKFGKLNIAFAHRQPGSSFKPIVYTEAFTQGYSPSSVLHDKPTNFAGYKPLNYDRKFRGDVTVRRALANSLNVPAVELLQNVGIANSINLAKQMGISTLTDPSKYGLSLVLGGAEVELFEMTRAYGVLADEGKFVPTHPILEIHDKQNKEIYSYDTKTLQEQDNLSNAFLKLFDAIKLNKQSEQVSNIEGDSVHTVIDPSFVYLTTSILSDDKARSEEFGTGSALHLASRPAAAKTGTTDDYKDSWTIGYTPSFVTGVWIGNNDGSPMLSVAGSIGAAPIWNRVMETYLRGKPVEQFIRPANVSEVEICLDPANANKAAVCVASCSNKTKEVFAQNPVPNLSCAIPTSIPTPTPGPSDSPTSEQPTDTPVPTDTPQPTTVPTATQAPTPTGFSFPTAIPTL